MNSTENEFNENITMLSPLHGVFTYDVEVCSIEIVSAYETLKLCFTMGEAYDHEYSQPLIDDLTK